MSKPANVVCDGDVCRIVTPEEAAAAAQHETPGNPITKLLGTKLLQQNGTTTTDAIVGPNKYLGLYFSAHWCPPCRGFTPELATFYKNFKAQHAQKDNFDIVFVSSDRDQNAFDEYYKEMPWLALPFEDRDTKAALSKKFKVRGIPTLVILDADSGEVITTDGRSEVDADKDGVNFPWRPKPISEALPGLLAGDLVDKEGKAHKAEEVLKGRVKLLYFSAHWCPPCRAFTPRLAETYKKLKDAGKDFELVFVSSDRDEASFKEYLDSMPWLALPFEKRDAKAALSKLFDVEGIPMLVVLDENNNLITVKGRNAVAEDPEGHNFPWIPQLVQALTDNSVSDVNDGPTVIYALGSASDESATKSQGQATLRPAAEAVKASGADPMGFMYAPRSADIMGRVLEFMGLGKAPEGDVLALLDIPSQEVFVCDLEGKAATSEVVQKFVQDYRAGALKGKPLGDDDDE